MLHQKSILITGGTGSFGTELVKVLLRDHDLRKIIIYSRDEYKQAMMAQAAARQPAALLHRRCA